MIEFIRIVAVAIVGSVILFAIVYALVSLFLTPTLLVICTLSYPILFLFGWLLHKWKVYRSNKR